LQTKQSLSEADISPDVGLGTGEAYTVDYLIPAGRQIFIQSGRQYPGFAQQMYTWRSNCFIMSNATDQQNASGDVRSNTVLEHKKRFQ